MLGKAYSMPPSIITIFSPKTCSRKIWPEFRWKLIRFRCFVILTVILFIRKWHCPWMNLLESNNRVHLISGLWSRTYIRRLDIYPVHIEMWRHHSFFVAKLKLELILSPIWIWRVLIFYPVWFYWCYNLPMF